MKYENMRSDWRLAERKTDRGNGSNRDKKHKNIISLKYSSIKDYICKIGIGSKIILYYETGILVQSR